MFRRDTILIVEDEPLIAMDLASVIEALDGQVVGPAASVAAALAIIETATIAAAILDANLADRDITPVALLLAERRVPFVVHSGIGVPAELKHALPSIRLVRKPASPHTVIAHLLATMAGD